MKKEQLNSILIKNILSYDGNDDWLFTEFLVVDTECDCCCRCWLLSLRIITVLLCFGEFGDEHGIGVVIGLTGLRRTIVGSAIDQSTIEEFKIIYVDIRYNAKKN